MLKRAWNDLGIRSKLIAIFIVIKVIPLLLLAWIAWHGHQLLASRLVEATSEIADSMRATVSLVGETMTDDSIKALDAAAREAIERLTTDTARDVAAFLYDRDGDIGQAARLPMTASAFDTFLKTHHRTVTRHPPWVLAADGSHWVPAETAPTPDVHVTPSAVDNERDFHYRQPDRVGVTETRPLFLEMTFVDATGHERLKVTSSDVMPTGLRDVTRKENTWLKAEDYWEALKALKPGEIWVSDVIGAYVPTHMIGTYTPAAAEKKGRAFAPQDSGYAGMENPVGRRYQGLVRWATPVVQDGRVAGWVTLALDQTHLAELVDRVVPTSERYSAITDAGSGNYAFIWDYLGRSIVHPRHYFIVGYDPATGAEVAPWLEDDLYREWQASGLPIADFLKTVPPFRDQSLKRKPSGAQVKAGTVALDCRYLNFAPQCSGWMDLTQHGGSGSFAIFWSGLWKLTTAAAIPYYTGPYAHSARGFGFVTIGANVDDFHRAATEAKTRIDGVVAERDAALTQRQENMYEMVTGQVAQMTRDLSLSTVAMMGLVILVAILMASAFTRRVTDMIHGVRRFQQGALDHRLTVGSADEMGQLISSFNAMADSVEESVSRLDEARRRAEELSRMKSEFLANVSHELRTPLNGILGFAEMLKDDVEGEENRENAGFILDSGRHLLDVVNALLDIAKIEAGRVTVTPETVDLAALLAAVAAPHRDVAAAKGLDLACAFAPDLPAHIVVDPTHLRRVLDNLLDNAVKFTDTGAVTLSAHHAAGEIVLAVRDTGPGIALAEQANIFEKFYQVGDFATRSHGGTGLGLALVQHLMQLLGGTIALDSRPGDGAMFSVTLPLVEPAEGVSPSGAERVS